MSPGGTVRRGNRSALVLTVHSPLKSERMMRIEFGAFVRATLVTSSLLMSASIAVAQTAVTTYQGQLKQSGVTVNGSHNFVFRLCSTSAGPGGVLQVYPPSPGVVPVNIVNGLFTQE